jgi:hypothetical protein
VHQFFPLVEFAFDSPLRQKTEATINPGLTYVADQWQVGAEAMRRRYFALPRALLSLTENRSGGALGPKDDARHRSVTVGEKTIEAQ